MVLKIMYLDVDVFSLFLFSSMFGYVYNTIVIDNKRSEGYVESGSR